MCGTLARPLIPRTDPFFNGILAQLATPGIRINSQYKNEDR